jgi:hypothetical protein
MKHEVSKSLCESVWYHTERSKRPRDSFSVDTCITAVDELVVTGRISVRGSISPPTPIRRLCVEMNENSRHIRFSGLSFSLFVTNTIRRLC